MALNRSLQEELGKLEAGILMTALWLVPIQGGGLRAWTCMGCKIQSRLMTGIWTLRQTASRSPSPVEVSAASVGTTTASAPPSAQSWARSAKSADVQLGDGFLNSTTTTGLPSLNFVSYSDILYLMQLS